MKQWHPPNDKDAFIVKPRLYISHKKAIFGNCIRLLLLVKAERGREKEGEGSSAQELQLRAFIQKIV